MTPFMPHPGSARARGSGSGAGAASAVAAPAGDPHIMNQRLKEMFRKQILRLRDAIYHITGWKVDMLVPPKKGAPTTITLRSMYAELESDKLVFQSLYDDEAQEFQQFHIVETPFFNRIDARVRSLLEYSNVPIPAFISAVTTDLFESSTVQPDM